QRDQEYFFELQTGFCPRCSMVQLTELVEQEKMFHGNYAFYSSTSVRMAQHFQKFAEHVQDTCLGENPFVVEIGSNDGIMLQHFASKGIRHLGIEPSANVAQVARDKGVNTVSRFFDADLAREIVAENGHADAFLGANVMCHIPYLHSVFEGVRILLKPHGVLAFEDPYLGDIVENTSYDQIYDEHAFYFSVSSVSYIAQQHGLELFHVAPQNVHGGSMRYYVGLAGAHPVSAAVTAQREKEKELQLDSAETYRRLRENIERSRDDLMRVLRELKAQGKRVVGYGATSKSTTVTNYCGITPDLIEFISDTTPIKQGKLSPGAHIPVRPYADFADRYPDVALLFAWNHGQEIMDKEQAYVAGGGKFLVYVPQVKVI
ncbi:MAG TPA: methyltransferase domain-containing protein, partial [Verrucomicrobiae bacterium]|nr:methyltransferase domain-containing protein [Verrucomicrobiae bacterium]